MSNITWWRSKDGIKYQLITRCLATQSCDQHEGKESITRTNFRIRGIAFPQDNLFYKLNTTNDQGMDSRAFQVQVLGKKIILI